MKIIYMRMFPVKVTASRGPESSYAIKCLSIMTNNMVYNSSLFNLRRVQIHLSKLGWQMVFVTKQNRVRVDFSIKILGILGGESEIDYE